MTRCLPALCIALTTGGCAEPLTELVVVVRTDATVPAMLSSIDLRVDGPTEIAVDATVTLASPEDIPQTLSLTPGTEQLGPVNVIAVGRGPGGLVITQEVETRFLAERRLILPLELNLVCDGEPCTPGATTCIDGTCRALEVDATTLAPFEGTIP